MLNLESLTTPAPTQPPPPNQPPIYPSPSPSPADLDPPLVQPSQLYTPHRLTPHLPNA